MVNDPQISQRLCKVVNKGLMHKRKRELLDMRKQF